MNTITSIFRNYKQISRAVKNVIAIQFCLDAVNTSFFLLLNYFMLDEGFTDYQAAQVFSYRFLAVFFVAFPLGLYIKGRRLKPFFLAASIGVPVFSILLIFAIDLHWDAWVNVSAMLWGASFTCMQVTALPYVLLNSDKKNHSESFALFFSAFSITLFTIGVSFFLLNFLQPTFFTEKRVLQFIAIFSFLALYFYSKIPKKEHLTEIVPFKSISKKYDWKLMIRALIPTFIIAIGAGFTVPVINLFFFTVHGIPAQVFSILGATTFLLVTIVMTLMPYIRRRFGYSIAITLFQSLSILALIILATTEYYANLSFAVVIAIVAYVLRQPLMSAARPMTTELVMYYVGKRNQEIMSAMSATLWSGSWFISMQLFAWMRQMEFQYVTIFLITAVLYIFGVSWYASLIASYRKRTGKSGKVTKSLV
ncbi:MAG: hypothetical protein AAFO07_22855 [Bacteroidota bacterium]